MKKIGVLGSGDVGKTLAAGLEKHGYEVRIGTRTPSKLAEFSSSSGIEAGTFEAVAAWAEGLVLAVKGSAAVETLGLAGTGNVEGKVILDPTNPIADAPPVDGVVRFFTGPNESLMERLQAAYPKARFVKAFNSVGNARMVDPAFAAGKPTMFFCGNDADAKKDVARIIEQLGWEPLCQLWCIPGFRQNSWTHAFKVLWS
jgi:predicted dinucleotide-binding enzyme